MKHTKKPGFTMIEVLTVLGLMSALLIAGTFVLQEQQLQAEEAHFFLNFKAEWEHFVSEGLNSGRMQSFFARKRDEISTEAYLKFDLKDGTPPHFLSIPDSLVLVHNRTLTPQDYDFYTKLTTLEFLRARNGKQSDVTIGFGWGVFTYKPNVSVKK